MLGVSIESKPGAAAIVTKKPITLDKEYLLVLVLFLIVLFSAKSYALIQAPTQVSLSDTNSFDVLIKNDSSSQVPLKINFYSPLKVEVSAPQYLGPFASTRARINLSNNKYSVDTQLTGTLEVIMGDRVEQQQVLLIVSPSIMGSSVSGLFSLASITQELTKFSLLEWIVFCLLVLIVIALLIGFVSRLGRKN